MMLLNINRNLMTSLSDIFSRFFQSQIKTVPTVPFLHEAIDVKNYPLTDMLEWHRDGGWDIIKSILSKAFADRINTGRLINDNVSIMESSHSNGWLIHCSRFEEVEDKGYNHLAHYLHTIVKSQGYILNLAEIKSRQHGSNLETVVKYYLKPSLRNRFIHDAESAIANQLYGNVTIEYKLIDGIPFEFKFLANAYQDRKFLPPDDFGRLMDAIISE